MTFTNSLIKDDPTDVSMGVFILNCDFTVYNLLDLEDMATSLVSVGTCTYMHIHVNNVKADVFPISHSLWTSQPMQNSFSHILKR